MATCFIGEQSGQYGFSMTGCKSTHSKRSLATKVTLFNLSVLSPEIVQNFNNLTDKLYLDELKVIFKLTVYNNNFTFLIISLIL